MNFTEAVAELAAGRCKGIRRAVWIPTAAWYPSKKEDGYVGDTMPFTKDFDAFLTTDWQLVDPAPQHEDVEVVRSMCGNCEKIYKTDIEAVGCCFETATCEAPLIRLAGTYRREVKPKVKRREEIMPDCSVKFACNDIVPTTGVKFFAEWEE